MSSVSKWPVGSRESCDVLSNPKYPITGESMTSKLGRVFATAAGTGAPAFACAAEAPELPAHFNLQTPVSIIAEQIYDLHTLIMWIIVGIFVLVFGVMTIAIVKH